MSWLTALKVIPWAQVIEHGPKVVDKARELLNKQAQAMQADSPASPAQDSQDVQALRQHLAGLEVQLHALQDDARSQAQTLAELAEQQVALMGVIQRLRRWIVALAVGVAASVAGWAWVVFRLSGA